MKIFIDAAEVDVVAVSFYTYKCTIKSNKQLILPSLKKSGNKKIICINF